MPAPTGPRHAAARSLPPSAAPRKPTRLVVRYLTAAMFTAFAAVVALPDLLFSLDQRSPFAQLVSFRPWILVCGLVVLVSLLVVLWFRRSAWPFAAGLLVVLLIGGAMVLPRVIADPVPTAGTPLTVLAFNTLEGAADVDEVAALVQAERPDIVALVEAGERYRSRIAPLVEPLGYRLHTSTPEGRADVDGITTLVGAGLGEVTFRIGEETSTFPYVEVTGGGLGELRFVAFHSVAPVPGSVVPWRSDVALVQQWCGGPTPAIVAGDFNATLDHSVLRDAMAGCDDAADLRGAGLVPTWGPGPRSREIGPQIDHVLATHGIAAETFAVHDVTDSDHRAIVTRLRIPT